MKIKDICAICGGNICAHVRTYVCLLPAFYMDVRDLNLCPLVCTPSVLTSSFLNVSIRFPGESQGDLHQPFTLVRESRPALFVPSWLVTANKGADTQNFKYRLPKEEVKMVGCPWGCPLSTLCDHQLPSCSTAFGGYLHE